MSGWDKLEKEVSKGPISGGVWIMIIMAVLALAGWFIFGVVGNVQEAGKVASEELGPRALNTKYEWFKNQSAALDAQQASIAVQESKVDGMRKRLGEDATKWPEDAAARYDKSETELRGMQVNFNRMAAEYNAEMSKWHTRFLNAGMMPEGAKDAPRREFKEYLYN